MHETLRLLLVIGLAALCLWQPALAAGPPAKIEIIWDSLAPSDGPPTISAAQGDIVYLAVVVRDADGKPLGGVALRICSLRGNSLAGPPPTTNETGYAQFTLVANHPGRDTVTVSHGALKGRIHLQVRQPEAVDDLARKERPSIGRIDNITSWATMMQASLNYDEQYRVSAQFGAPVKKLIGQRIRLAGFVLPLQMNEAQTHFILSANTRPASFICRADRPRSLKSTPATALRSAGTRSWSKAGSRPTRRPTTASSIA